VVPEKVSIIHGFFAVNNRFQSHTYHSLTLCQTLACLVTSHQTLVCSHDLISNPGLLSWPRNKPWLALMTSHQTLACSHDLIPNPGLLSWPHIKPWFALVTSYQTLACSHDFIPNHQATLME
jgi:hypothetical protein